MLISDNYLKQQQELHKNELYGVASMQYAPLVTSLINALEINEMLDYGCGKGRLAQSINPDRQVTIELYDPAMPDFSEPPSPREFVCCIDVLEHIEPDCLDDVLDDLKRLTKRVGFFSIHTGPAVKTLDDGRNAHLIQESYRWWLPKIMDRFEVKTLSHTSGGFYVITANRCQE